MNDQKWPWYKKNNQTCFTIIKWNEKDGEEHLIKKNFFCSLLLLLDNFHEGVLNKKRLEETELTKNGQEKRWNRWFQMKWNQKDGAGHLIKLITSQCQF